MSLRTESPLQSLQLIIIIQVTVSFTWVAKLSVGPSTFPTSRHAFPVLSLLISCKYLPKRSYLDMTKIELYYGCSEAPWYLNQRKISSHSWRRQSRVRLLDITQPVWSQTHSTCDYLSWASRERPSLHLFVCLKYICVSFLHSKRNLANFLSASDSTFSKWLMDGRWARGTLPLIAE